MILIGLTGFAKSGKSTISNYLVEKHNFIELSFAEPLKQVVKILFNLSNDEDKYLYDNNYKECVIPRIGFTGRELLQKIGTELFRNKLPEILPIKNIWIDIMNNKISSLINSKKIKGIVVSDCRFNDEYELLKSYKFNVYNICKNNLNILNNKLYLHESEKGCKYDSIIFNNSTIDDLFKIIENILLSSTDLSDKLNNHHC